MNGEPRWRRRKADRPGEIVAAALREFAGKGFANARLDEIARSAGVTKAAVYRYFDTKETLFRAAATSAIAPNLDALADAVASSSEPLTEMLPALLVQVARTASQGELPAVIRLVISESRAFPDLAAIWHETVVAPMLGRLEELIARAQGRGELGPGQPRLLAFSLAGPLLMGMLYREVFTGVAADPPDLEALATSHASIFLNGTLGKPAATMENRHET